MLVDHCTGDPRFDASLAQVVGGFVDAGRLRQVGVVHVFESSFTCLLKRRPTIADASSQDALPPSAGASARSSGRPSRARASIRRSPRRPARQPLRRCVLRTLRALVEARLKPSRQLRRRHRLIRTGACDNSSTAIGGSTKRWGSSQCTSAGEQGQTNAHRIWSRRAQPDRLRRRVHALAEPLDAPPIACDARLAPTPVSEQVELFAPTG